MKIHRRDLDICFLLLAATFTVAVNYFLPSSCDTCIGVIKRHLVTGKYIIVVVLFSEDVGYF